jgi:2-isopropylmalate synthase
MPFDSRRYRPINSVDFPQRRWPNQRLTAAPRWCSVDLRDGNQALVEPMGSDRKLRLFEHLVRIGYKEIEVGFPAASQTDFDFVRMLIDGGHVPEDVTIQVLVQAREPLIARTFEAIRGARRVIVHLYNSTSTVQRRVVFGMTPEAVRDLAVRGTQWVKSRALELVGTEVVFEYSPESFTGTELDVAVAICDAVVDAWDPSPEHKMIINLPATVEMTTPNVYADQIEWMIGHLARRSSVVVSVHAHNDRGCAVAATELALLAGAERVEGTLFGNGERTGNVDLVTLAMNLYSQGIDPEIDFSNLAETVRVYEECCRLVVPPRHPYAGELVFTAFSGSHQDAIRKGLEALSNQTHAAWEVPYLPIDPSDLGRKYEPLVRINSQSGKGGIAFVLERSAGYRVPKGLAIEFSRVIQRITDGTGKELRPEAVVAAFDEEYLVAGPDAPEVSCEIHRRTEELCEVSGVVRYKGEERRVQGAGNGPIDAFLKGFNRAFGVELHCVDYSEHALDEREDAKAISYVQLRMGDRVKYGVGIANDISIASLRAVVSAATRFGATLSARANESRAGFASELSS